MNQEQWQEANQTTHETPETSTSTNFVPVTETMAAEPVNNQQVVPQKEAAKTNTANNPFDFNSIFVFVQKFFSNNPVQLMNRQLQVKLYDQLLILGIFFIALPLLASLVMYLTLDGFAFNSYLSFFRIGFGTMFKTIFGMQVMISILYFALWCGLEFIMKGNVKWDLMLGQFTKIVLPIICASVVALLVSILSSSIAFAIFFAGLVAALLLTLMSYDEPSVRLHLANYWIFLIFIMAVFFIVVPMTSALIFS